MILHCSVRLGVLVGSLISEYWNVLSSSTVFFPPVLDSAYSSFLVLLHPSHCTPRSLMTHSFYTGSSLRAWRH